MSEYIKLITEMNGLKVGEQYYSNTSDITRLIVALTSEEVSYIYIGDDALENNMSIALISHFKANNTKTHEADGSPVQKWVVPNNAEHAGMGLKCRVRDHLDSAWLGDRIFLYKNMKGVDFPFVVDDGLGNHYKCCEVQVDIN